MAQRDNRKFSFCRVCGGDRHHSVRRKLHRSYGTAGDYFWGANTWQILECLGCQTVTFAHEHWSCEYGDETEDAEVFRELFPPPTWRKEPEWLSRRRLALGMPIGALWVLGMHHDIYRALGLQAFGLAAMGARAIIDFIVTSQAGDSGNFRMKIDRMCKQGLISPLQAVTIDAAWEAGSAAIHRGHIPEADDVNALLDITENLIEKIYIDPAREKQRAQAAAALRARTPPRPKREPLEK